MANETTSSSGLVDLERELTCSICTELLYQPLTLLDCLHTFCGACLKNWFTWQASNPSDSSHRSPFTCPACRAHVRDTRHDAKVNTLLDLFLQSNPSKAKPADERDDIAKEYNPADPVLPVINQREPSSDDEADRRLLAEVREMSLRESGERNRNTSASHPRSRTRRERSPGDRAREQRLEDARRRRRAERHMNLPPQMRNPRDPSPQSRQVEHQSSLRSILSSTTQEPAIEEEILRQIAEEGLLDGIDLQSLTPRQEDELTERIAEAFRRRQQEQTISRESRRPENRRVDVNAERRAESRSRPNSGPGRATRPDRHPPPSRSNLLQPTSPAASSHRRSLSDQGTRRRRTSPTPTSNPSHSTDSLAQSTSRSSNPNSRRRASNHSLPPPSFPRGPSSTSSTVSRRPGSAGERPASTRRTVSRNVPDRQPVESPTPIVISTPAGPRPATSRIEHPTPALDAPETGLSGAQPALQSSHPAPCSPAQSSLSPRQVPSISCERCERSNIEYELHKYCSKCKDGNYNLCQRCFRLGRGCLHWFGFGDAALYYFEKNSPSSDSSMDPRDAPHFLRSRRYIRQERMAQVAVQEAGTSASLSSSTQLQTGMFCDICESFADDCFWKCGDCNYGEWGFCNRCVNRGKCCTHPLLPITPIRNDSSSPNSSLTGRTLSEGTLPIARQPAIPTFTEGYQPLTFSTKCNICTYPIPPSSTRFHCSECNDGNYDLCINCYLKLGASGKISKDNGRNGWRRCLHGHRMIIVGFEDHDDGQRRVIVKDLVGGHAMTEESSPGSPTSPGDASSTSQHNAPPTSPITDPDLALRRPKRQDSGRWTWSELSNGSASNNANIGHRRRLNRSRHYMVSALDHSESSAVSNSNPTKAPLLPRFPPSGGIGLKFVANWSHYPGPDDKDEIMFPRGAEITEAENINDDWLWGYYAGQTGFFPGGHVIPIDEVTM